MADALSVGDRHCAIPDNKRDKRKLPVERGTDLNGEQSEQYARYVVRIGSISGKRRVISNSVLSPWPKKKGKKGKRSNAERERTRLKLRSISSIADNLSFAKMDDGIVYEMIIIGISLGIIENVSRNVLILFRNRIKLFC